MGYLYAEKVNNGTSHSILLKKQKLRLCHGDEGTYSISLFTPDLQNQKHWTTVTHFHNMSRLSFIYYFKHEHIIKQGIQWKTNWLKYSVIVLEKKSLK